MRTRIFAFTVGVAMTSSCGATPKLKSITNEKRVVCTYGKDVVYDGMAISFYKRDVHWFIKESNGNIYRVPGHCEVKSEG